MPFEKEASEIIARIDNTRSLISEVNNKVGAEIANLKSIADVIKKLTDDVNKNVSLQSKVYKRSFVDNKVIINKKTTTVFDSLLKKEDTITKIITTLKNTQIALESADHLLSESDEFKETPATIPAESAALPGQVGLEGISRDKSIEAPVNDVAHPSEGEGSF